MIRLIDLIEWEVGDIDVGLETRFERCTDTAETVPVHASEEVVDFDLARASVTGGGTKSVRRRAEEPVQYMSMSRRGVAGRERQEIEGDQELTSK